MAQVGGADGLGGAGGQALGGGRRAAVLAALIWLPGAIGRQLDAEQERWFLWLPVLFGTGIALYFALPTEPLMVVTLMPALAALALHLVGPRTGLLGLLTGALLAATLGLAAAKLRTEAVRAPVLQSQP